MMLMEEAERIARDEHGSCKLAVISGGDFKNGAGGLHLSPPQASKNKHLIKPYHDLKDLIAAKIQYHMCAVVISEQNYTTFPLHI